jgi:hypothetical protein
MAQAKLGTALASRRADFKLRDSVHIDTFEISLSDGSKRTISLT